MVYRKCTAGDDDVLMFIFFSFTRCRIAETRDVRGVPPGERSRDVLRSRIFDMCFRSAVVPE